MFDLSLFYTQFLFLLLLALKQWVGNSAQEINYYKLLMFSSVRPLALFNAEIKIHILVKLSLSCLIYHFFARGLAQACPSQLMGRQLSSRNLILQTSVVYSFTPDFIFHQCKMRKFSNSGEISCDHENIDPGWLG